MGISVFPAPSSGGIKSVQRGVTTSAVTVTITAVDTSKSFVTTYSDASSGNVSIVGGGGATLQETATAQFGTSWAARSFGAYLSSSTQLVTSGAVRWEVVEFN